MAADQGIPGRHKKAHTGRAGLGLVTYSANLISKPVVLKGDMQESPIP